MPIIVQKPPAQPSGISLEDAEAMALALGDGLPGEGEFLTTGEMFTERKEANAAAQKFIRYIESRYDVKLRSRTWSPGDEQWTFGIRPVTPADEAEAATQAEGEGGKKK